MVFQSYALYPHLSVYDNIAFSLKLHKVPKAEIDKRVRDAARILDLEPYLKRKPKALSGGQRQRVAMGRAIVRQPSAFLMDEPLSNLDAKLRVQMRAEIRGLQRDLGVTTIYVTHDQVEAMTMGDRVAVMRKGELQQAADPQELYDHPVNLFVAGFIGSPAMNMLEATLQREDGTMKVVTGSQEIQLSEETLSQRPALRGYEGRKVVLGIRPEDLEDDQLAGETAHGGTLEGTVTLREALGAEIMVHFSVDAPPAFTADVKELAEDVGEAERAEAHAGEGTAVDRRPLRRPFPREAGRAGRRRGRHAPAPLLRRRHRASASTPEPSEGRSALHGAGGEARQDVALEDQHERDERHGDDDRRGHDRAPRLLERAAGLADERRDRDRDRVLVRVLDEGEREQVLVPGGDEREQPGRHEARKQQRQEHLVEDLERRRTVDVRRLLEIPGQRLA